ncbi:glutamate ABC transporter substrate-binding protein [Nocardioides panaciterrulae]|uniref:Glutamate transport system substrate-binding protein n=1 Tax=Nocardioides panaciterrulae TaxID=661492 RepID=A0A7Y9J9W7_9ACTN|nr:glutamate ABC transporter substrate-binding protein [Nocardioides panaciterrulae]NYD41095.1 glutamate transport system substrate-binding protein [Nocardioides panaciterrulae]
MALLISGRGRRAVALATVAAASITVLAACGNSSDAPSIDGIGAKAGASYDKIITSAPVASAADVDQNAWAKKIKAQGYLKVGGTDSGPLFSIKDINTGELTGFDAGLSQMLAHYITGKDDVKALTQLTITSVDTRETMLQNNTVDAVFATYSITPERAQKVDFAGPYYQSGDAIMVQKDNTSIKGVDDLNGKTVATESSSTAALAVKKLAPKAKVLLFKEDQQCVAAVQQGRADAYVLDQGILLGDALSNDSVKLVGGDPFTVDPYGVGLNKDTDAKPFVNAFLKKIYASGDWAKLWKATIGTVVSGDAPKPPTIGSVPGS